MPSELTALLGDATLTWTERRTRLQGWSGPEARLADASPGAQRISAAVCAVGAFAGAVTGSPLLLAVFAATALVGPVVLFSGGSLMVGTVGRTDLLSDERREALARDLYRALRDRILALPAVLRGGFSGWTALAGHEAATGA